jgi:hypothetical protein
MIGIQRLLFFCVVVAAAGVLVLSCKDEDTGDSSFGLLQEKVLTTSCALSGCHSSTSDATFIQHKLLLSEGASYENLVGVEPTNSDALKDGLLRVKPDDAHSSLLYFKIAGAGHHTKSYGNPMPLGLSLLTVGQVEFIRLWIEAGAPLKGSVADPALLDDTTPQEESFEPLVPPAAGKGFQMSLSKFPVSPNFEREFFVYKKVGNTEEVFVNRIEIKMRQNSHHFILYDFEPAIPPHFVPGNDIVRDLRYADGTLNTTALLPMGYHVFVVGTQTPYLDYKLPDGVAIALPAGMSLDCNSHYVNKSNDEIEGEVNVNLHTVSKSTVTKIAHSINFANNSLSLPAKQKTTATKTFLFDKSVSVLSLTSHTHQLAEKFVIRIKGGPRDGEVVYTNLDWHHPPLINLSPPITLSAGQGFTSEIIYNNTTDARVVFGLTSTDEMGIIFGYYTEN